MPRILLVKTSSLGDVVHNLPVVSDIASAVSGADIHWVVEEAFAALPELHPAVRRILPVAVRRWRAAPWKADTRRELESFVQTLRSVRYDAIIDTQGLFKSAFITRAARGSRYGFGWRASREPLFPFYDRTFHVPRSLHAVERNRVLAGRALGYQVPAGTEYGIRTLSSPAPDPLNGYAVLIHATSATNKLWPEELWVALGRGLAKLGLRGVLPWGSEDERARSERLARAIPDAVAPPRMTLSEAASLLADARCAVGVDTGLTHLAGALGVPTVGIYVATDPARTGLYGCARAASIGGPAQLPRAEEVLRTLQTVTR